jgi:hypothetical protein
MNDDRYFFVSLSEPVAWLLASILAVFVVIQLILRRDANGQSPELRHIMAWVFLAGTTFLLANAIVVFNLAVFRTAAIPYWPAGLLFAGAVVCAGIAAIARYAKNG